jgi:hypothetical protein
MDVLVQYIACHLDVKAMFWIAGRREVDGRCMQQQYNLQSQQCNLTRSMANNNSISNFHPNAPHLLGSTSRENVGMGSEYFTTTALRYWLHTQYYPEVISMKYPGWD